MTAIGVVQILLYLAILVALVKPLGAFMARVYQGKPCGLDRVLGWLERLIYRVCRVNPAADMSWKTYTCGVPRLQRRGVPRRLPAPALPGQAPAQPREPAGDDLALRVQHRRQLRDEHELAGLRRRNDDELPDPDARAHGPELRLGRVPAWPCLVALIRGFTRKTASGIGNFWFDLVRSTLYILLPLSIVLALLLAASGVVQTFDPYAKATLTRSLRRRRERPGHRAGDRGRPGRFADRDQAARHERRRVLQRELGASVREPDALRRTCSSACRSC